jgi:hypothetical protein
MILISRPRRGRTFSQDDDGFFAGRCAQGLILVRAAANRFRGCSFRVNTDGISPLRFDLMTEFNSTRPDRVDSCD